MRIALSLLLLSAAPAAALCQWTPQASGTDAEFRGLSVVNADVVWASGTGGRVARTADGGATWRVDSVPGASKLDFRDIEALDTRTAIALSAGPAEQGQARLYRTTDAGVSWQLVYRTDLRGVFLDAVAFWDADHGIVMGDPVDGRFFVLTTSDGGRSWTRVPPSRIPPAITGEAAFAASGTCLTTQGATNAWIASGGGAVARVYRTTDRGATWSVAPTPLHAGNASSGAFSLAFRDAATGVVVGGDYARPREPLPDVALSADGGATWTRPAGPLPTGYMSAVAYVSPPARGAAAERRARGGQDTVVAVGLAGTALSRDGGRSWAMVDSTAYNSVQFASPDAGWAVGPHGRIARWAGMRGGSPAGRP